MYLWSRDEEEKQCKEGEGRWSEEGELEVTREEVRWVVRRAHPQRTKDDTGSEGDGSDTLQQTKESEGRRATLCESATDDSRVTEEDGGGVDGRGKGDEPTKRREDGVHLENVDVLKRDPLVLKHATPAQSK